MKRRIHPSAAITVAGLALCWILGGTYLRVNGLVRSLTHRAQAALPAPQEWDAAPSPQPAARHWPAALLSILPLTFRLNREPRPRKPGFAAKLLRREGAPFRSRSLPGRSADARFQFPPGEESARPFAEGDTPRSAAGSSQTVLPKGGLAMRIVHLILLLFGLAALKGTLGGAALFRRVGEGLRLLAAPLETAFARLRLGWANLRPRLQAKADVLSSRLRETLTQLPPPKRLFALWQRSARWGLALSAPLREKAAERLELLTFEMQHRRTPALPPADPAALLPAGYIEEPEPLCLIAAAPPGGEVLRCRPVIPIRRSPPTGQPGSARCLSGGNQENADFIPPSLPALSEVELPRT